MKTLYYRSRMVIGIVSSAGTPRGAVSARTVVSSLTGIEGSVRTHLAHIFPKLGVAARSELAAQAATRDL
jgi:DNA-binding NarL/FixJ family response regulator